MAELTKIIAPIKGAKMVSSAFLFKILLFNDIKHQTWFIDGNGPGVYWKTSPGPTLIFFADKPDGNNPSGLSENAFNQGYSNIQLFYWETFRIFK